MSIKNLTYIAILAVILLVLNGCESNAARHEEAFSKHQEWSEADRLMISQGLIRKGMTRDQVRAAWGKPCMTCTGTKKYENGVQSWEFHTQVVFFDKDDIVTRWVDR